MHVDSLARKAKEAWHNSYYRWSMAYLMAVNTAILVTLLVGPGKL